LPPRRRRYQGKKYAALSETLALPGCHGSKKYAALGGAASSALSFGLDDVPASPAASLLASEAAALGANVIVIANTST